MNNAPRMSVGESIQQLQGVLQAVRDGDWPIVEPLLKSYPVNVFEEHQDVFAVIGGGVHGCDIGMVKGRLDLNLAAEAGDEIGVVFLTRQDDLHGFDALRKDVTDF